LLQAVEANRKALEQFVGRGAGLQEGPLKEAVGNLEKMEDMFFAAVSKATQASGPLQPAWDNVLSSMKMKGTDTGAQASAVVEQVMEQARTALRDGRASSMRAAQAMLDSYAALVSGVLIGMSEGMQAGTKRSGASGGGGGGTRGGQEERVARPQTLTAPRGDGQGARSLAGRAPVRTPGASPRSR